MTSLAATQDFGPFFGFTVSVGASARIIGDDLRSRLIGDGGAAENGE